MSRWKSLGQLEPYLRASDRSEWQEYARLDLAGVRKDAVILLDDLVRKMADYTRDEREKFVSGLIEELLKAHTLLTVREFRFVIRQPLFVKIVLPVLLDRFEQKKPNSARDILLFEQQLVGAEVEQIIGDRRLTHLLAKWPLRERALEQSPVDRVAAYEVRELWARACVEWFDFAIHEVPCGVLYGMNAATSEEIEDLLEQLCLFRARCKEWDLENDYTAAIANWNLYFTRWRDYLLFRTNSQSFENYLNRDQQDA